MSISIQSIMKSPVVCVEMDDTLKVVKSIFDQTRFHHLLVVESKKLFGIISDRDLLKVLSPTLGTAAESRSDLNKLNMKAHQIMSRNPVCISQNDDLTNAVDLFLKNPISSLPVIDENTIPVGIISWRDILKVIQQSGAENISIK